MANCSVKLNIISKITSLIISEKSTMKSKIYYHAGLSRISDFYIPYGGLHMGGQGSALEAGLRKLRQSGEGNLFLHKVLVNDQSLVEINDLGDSHSWQKSWDYSSQEANSIHSGWIYTNNFEPDPKKSICIFDLKIINSIESCDILSLDEAEDKPISYEMKHCWPDYIL